MNSRSILRYFGFGAVPAAAGGTVILPPALKVGESLTVINSGNQLLTIQHWPKVFAATDKIKSLENYKGSLEAD